MKTKFLIVLLILLSGNLYAQEKTFSSKELDGIIVNIKNNPQETQVSWENNTCTFTFIFYSKNGELEYSTPAECYFYLSDYKEEQFNFKKIDIITEGKYLILKDKTTNNLTPMIWELTKIDDTSLKIGESVFKVIKKE